jgi:hypothetical protein
MIRVSLRKRFNSNWIRLSARVRTRLGGLGAATAGTEATPDGEALVRVVVVGAGFQAIEDGLEGAGADGKDVETFGRALGRTKAWP